MLTRHLGGLATAGPVALLGMALTAFASLSFLRQRRTRRRLSAYFPPAVLDKLGARDAASLAPCRRLVTTRAAENQD